MAIAVVDERGVPTAFSRMDGAPLLAVKIAQDQGVHRGGLLAVDGRLGFDFVKDDAPRAMARRPGMSGSSSRRRLPLKSGDAMIGSLGVALATTGLSNATTCSAPVQYRAHVGHQRDRRKPA